MHMYKYNTFRDELYVAGFQQNAQELATLTRKKLSNRGISQLNLAKYEFELRNYHTEEASKLVMDYNSDVANGLTDELAANRLREYGPNVVDPPKESPLWVKFIASFFGGFLPLLWIAAVLAFLSWRPLGYAFYDLYSLMLGIILICVIFISGTVTFYQEWRVSRLLTAYQVEEFRYTVLRSGNMEQIESSQIVVGDIVILSADEKVPADMRIVECTELEIDTSFLTGEVALMRVTAAPLPPVITYLEATNTIFMGTTIVHGTGKGLVIATGDRTQLAKITQDCVKYVSVTAVQRELQRMMILLSIILLLLVILLLLYEELYLRPRHIHNMPMSSITFDIVYLIIAVIPIGFPVVVSLGLVIVARRLINTENLLFKRLGNMTTLGAMSLLASDKTGTLTQNLMAVTSLLCVDTRNGSNNHDETKRSDECGHCDVISNATSRVAALCNQAVLTEHVSSKGYPERRQEKDVRGDIEIGTVKMHRHEQSARKDISTNTAGGNSTDRGILLWASLHTDVALLKSQYHVERMVPFNSKSKAAYVMVRHMSSNEMFVLTKGAPEILLEHCGYYINVDGIETVMTEEQRTDIQGRIDIEASTGSNMIALAQRALSPHEFPSSFEFREIREPNIPTTDLTFVSCLALSDPPREGVREAIYELREAGIQVIMITGDAMETALTVAKAVDIVSDNEAPIHTVDHLHRRLGAAMQSANQGVILVTGPEVDRLTQLEWDYIFQHDEKIFARTTPQQKLEIVAQCQERGFIVGVTGDGINDASALKKADVGIAMHDGSEVAREVAGVVLLDNNLASVVHGVKEGRLLFANLRKTVLLSLAVACWTELLSVLGTCFLGLPKPLSIFNMFIISCLTDTFAGLALMCETAEPGLMRASPSDFRNKKMISVGLVLDSFFFYGTMVAFGAFVNYFAYMAESGYYQHELLFSWWRPAVQSGDSVRGQMDISVWKTASSVYMLSVVIAQMALLLSVCKSQPYLYNVFMSEVNDRNVARSTSLTSMLYKQTMKVAPVILAWITLVATLCLFLYIPLFHDCCRTAVVPAKYWGISVGWAVLWFAIAEIRKWIFVCCPGTCVSW